MKKHLPELVMIISKQAIYAIILICLGQSLLLANEISGQSMHEIHISINMKKALLPEVLRKIENKTEFTFAYGDEVKAIKTMLTMDYKNVAVANILKDITQRTGVEFRQVNQTISAKGNPKAIKRIKDSFRIEDKLDKTITGKVVDENGEGLPGVSIIVKGTNTGTTTDMNGEYKLTVPGNAILIFSFVGYSSLEREVGSQSVLDVEMIPNIQELGEIVVIGYGTKKKESLTGAIATVDAEVIENRPSASTTELLQGVAAGLTITRSNAGRIANTGSGINIRGVSSRNNPGVLIIIDGIPHSSTETNALDQINPYDIESISILKDAQAAIYGARAAGGVILITTKTGKTEKPVISGQVMYTLNVPDPQFRSTNTLQYLEMQNEGFVNDGQPNNLFTPNIDFVRENNITIDAINSVTDNNYLSHPWPYDNTGTLLVYSNTDWQDVLFDPALMQNYNFSVSGRTERSNYFTSLSVVDQQGMISTGTNFNRKYFMRVKYDYDVTDWLRLRTNLSLERQKVAEPSAYTRGHGWAGGFENWVGFMSSWAPVYTREGNYYNMGSFENAYAMLKEGGVSTGINHRMKTILGTQIRPTKHVTVDADIATNIDLYNNEWYSLGYDTYNWREQFSRNSLFNRNSAGVTSTDEWHYIGNVVVRYENTFKEKHNFSHMAGYSHEEYDRHRTSAERRLGSISRQNPSMIFGDAAEQYNWEDKIDWALQSVFSRLTYDYDNKYFLELIYRRDGSSRFAEGFKWANFYGIQGAWNLTNEKFMENINPKWLSFLKVRATYGEAGNQASIGLYDFVSQINISGNYPFGDPNAPVQTQSATLTGLASPTRTWEVVETQNIGVDIEAFDNKLSANFDYFVRNNRNMFYNRELPSVLGIDPPTENGAHLRAWGWELTMEYRDKIGDFSYNVGFNLSNTDNEVVSLDEPIVPQYGYNAFVEGNSTGSYYGFKFDGIIQDETELQAYKDRFSNGGIPNNISTGDVRYLDLDGDGQLEWNVYEVGPDGNPTANSGDVVLLGDDGIHFTYGITLGAQYKGFSFSALLQGVGEWLVHDGQQWWQRPISGYANQPMLHYYGNTWTPENRNAQYPRLSQDWGLNSYNLRRSDAPHVGHNNRYLRLKNIRFGYSLPRSLLNQVNLQRVDVFVSGNDIWETRNIPGHTNVENPFAKLTTPFPRGYSFGLNITL